MGDSFLSIPRLSSLLELRCMPHNYQSPPFGLIIGLLSNGEGLFVLLPSSTRARGGLIFVRGNSGPRYGPSGPRNATNFQFP